MFWARSFSKNEAVTSEMCLKILQNDLMPQLERIMVKENRFGLCIIAPRLIMRRLCEIG